MTIIFYTTSKNDHNEKSYSFLVGIIYWNVAYIVIQTIHFVIGIVYVFKKLPLNFIISLAFGVLSVTSTIVGNGFINSDCRYFVKRKCEYLKFCQYFTVNTLYKNRYNRIVNR